MSKDPYYKCNTVTPEEQSDLQNQGAKFANDAVQNSVNWSFYVLSLLIVVGFIALNTKIKASSSSSSLILLTLVICLFFVLIFWFTSIARSEGFKGKKKNKKGKSKKNKTNKKKSKKNKKADIKADVKAGTKNEPKPVKQKSNLNPTLIAVLPVLAFGFIATIANVLYHR